MACSDTVLVRATALVLLCSLVVITPASFGQPASEKQPDPERIKRMIKRMDEAGYTSFRVVDSDRTPVAGAIVAEIFSVGQDAQGQPRVWTMLGWSDMPPLRTNEQGIAQVSKLFLKPGKTMWAWQEESRLLGKCELSEELDQVVEIVLHPTYRLYGAVTTPEGRPVEIVNVTVEGAPFPTSGGRPRGPTQYEFFLPAGEYEVRMQSASAYTVAEEVKITPSQPETELNFRVVPRRFLRFIGQPAPELREIKGWKNGGPVTLEELRGKVVLLDFWGFWCGPCVVDMPKLMKLHDDYAEHGLVIIAVHDDSVESIEEMDRRLAQVRTRLWDGRDLPFLVALDGGGPTPIEETDETTRGATTAAYGIYSFPTMLLIDRDGLLVTEFYYGREAHMRLLRQLLEVPESSP